MTFVARIASLIFHPLLMASYLFVIMMYTLPAALSPLTPNLFKAFLVLIFLITFVLPVINIGIFKVFGSISSPTMPERRERVLPAVFIAILYLLMTYMFHSRFGISYTDNLFKMLVVIDLLVLIPVIITFFYKISIHSAGIAGLLGIIFPLNQISEDNALFYPTIGLMMATGVVMSSRLHLQAHTYREVTLGAMVGFTTGFLSMMLLF